MKILIFIITKSIRYCSGKLGGWLSCKTLDLIEDEGCGVDSGDKTQYLLISYTCPVLLCSQEQKVIPREFRNSQEIFK